MTMLMSGTLKSHLEEVDVSVEKMLNRLIVQMKKQEKVTEGLKATNQMEWVQRMNNIRNRAEEIVYEELIYAKEEFFISKKMHRYCMIAEIATKQKRTANLNTTNFRWKYRLKRISWSIKLANT